MPPEAAEPSLLSLLALGNQGWGDELLYGAWLTLQLALFSLVGGLVLGLLLTMAKVSRLRIGPVRPLGILAGVYTAIIRGTPEFLILLLVYYGLPLLLAGDPSAPDAALSPFVAGVIGLSLIFGAYASEVMRGAWQAVGKGQIEAAVACGLSGPQILVWIRLPQMLRFALPGLGNLWMVLLKDTSLASVITVNELQRQAKVAGENTGQPLLFYAAAAVLYLSLTVISDQGRFALERRAQRGHLPAAGAKG